MSEDDTEDRDDDWFESAIGGDDADDEGTDAAPTDETEASEGRDESTDASEGTDEPTAASGSDELPDHEGGPEGPPDSSADVPPDDPDWGDEDATGGDTSSFADEGESVFGGPGDDAPFEDTGDSLIDEGGESSFDEEGGLFDDDFASAFGQAGDDEFDDEDFDSEIPRIDVGIHGLDNMIQGGVPERHLMVAIGSAGTGKTTFGLQFLQHGLAQGDDCVFITLEQSKEAILDTAAEHGWDFDAHEADDRLAVIDLDPIEMANSLDNIRGELPDLVAEFDADRFVLDSVSLLEMMYDDQARRRTEIYDFSRSLKRAGVTTLLTSEADEDNPYASRHGIIEYLTDAVFVLQYVRAETRETRLAVEIQKIRNANHSRETKPYEITDEGISVYEQANIF